MASIVPKPIWLKRLERTILVRFEAARRRTKRLCQHAVIMSVVFRYTGIALSPEQ